MILVERSSLTDEFKLNLLNIILVYLLNENYLKSLKPDLHLTCLNQILALFKHRNSIEFFESLNSLIYKCGYKMRRI